MTGNFGISEMISSPSPIITFLIESIRKNGLRLNDTTEIIIKCVEEINLSDAQLGFQLIISLFSNRDNIS